MGLHVSWYETMNVTKRLDVTDGALRRLLDDDIVIRPVRELGDVFASVFRDDENIVLSISSSSLQVIRNHDHRLHGNHHPSLQHRFDVLPEFQLSFATVVMGEDAE